MKKIKIGILFGGPSREREISFAGGRTVYDNLNKTLFEAIPIFVDSFKNFILVDWEYIYKGSIRDFYPNPSVQRSKYSIPVYAESCRQDEIDVSINAIGKKIEPQNLKKCFDFAFLCLHGEFGEDGQVQGLLESLELPYSGSGILPSSIGMNKAVQKDLLKNAGFDGPEMIKIDRKDWRNNTNNYYQDTLDNIGLPCVIRPANQGSSIGVSICNESISQEEFTEKINAAFFIENVNVTAWKHSSEEDKITQLQEITDIRSGIGFPMTIDNTLVINHPDQLKKLLDQSDKEVITIEAHNSETIVIIESFIHGREFSCIVLRDEDGSCKALPPTEIKKGTEVFDYRSKYLPGLSRKETPIELPYAEIEKIRKECCRLYEFLGFHVYARIDGFYNNEGEIFLNDPNTTSGMLPSSFFFHQAAEIGLNPSEFLTFLIRNSLNERISSSLNKRIQFEKLLFELDEMIINSNHQTNTKKRVAVILGGYSFERHISVESGRNIYEKLASSDKYEPIPLFLSGDKDKYQLHRIPINLLLKDNADDISEKVHNYRPHDIIKDIQKECASISEKYINSVFIKEPEHWTLDKLQEEVSAVFIALHGRPGEDGTLQKDLERLNIPYNGSNSDSSNTTINKYKTSQTLKKAGYAVANQLLISKNEYLNSKEEAIGKIKSMVDYPFIAKPVDDGCSSAVKMIKTQEQLEVFVDTLFRDDWKIDESSRIALGLKFNEEFPIKNEVLIESLIDANGAKEFIEVTSGLLTHHDENGNIEYEMFEPSEALSTGEVLSLEEKFLAGEGQNITPARLGESKEAYNRISSKVKEDLKGAAKLLGVQGYARIDAFVRVYDNNEVETVFIEVNSLPGMTPATCIFHQCAINGYKPYDFIDKIIEYGIQNKKELV